MSAPGVFEQRDAVTAAIEEYARKHHADLTGADGIRVWKDKAAA